MAQYHVAYERDHKGLRDLTDPRLFETRYWSPQLLLWELGPEGWRVVLRLPKYAPRRRSLAVGVQLPLLHQVAASTE